MRLLVFFACLLTTGLAKVASSKGRQELVESSGFGGSGAASEVENEDIVGPITTTEIDLSTDEYEEVTKQRYITYYFLIEPSADEEFEDYMEECIYVAPKLQDCLNPIGSEVLQCDEKSAEEQVTEASVYPSNLDSNVAALDMEKSNNETSSPQIQAKRSILQLETCSVPFEFQVPHCTHPPRDHDIVQIIKPYYTEVTPECTEVSLPIVFHPLGGRYHTVAEANAIFDNERHTTATNTPNTNLDAPVSDAEIEEDFQMDDMINKAMLQFADNWKKPEVHPDTPGNRFGDLLPRPRFRRSTKGRINPNKKEIRVYKARS